METYKRVLKHPDPEHEHKIRNFESCLARDRTQNGTVCQTTYRILQTRPQHFTRLTWADIGRFWIRSRSQFHNTFKITSLGMLIKPSYNGRNKMISLWADTTIGNVHSTYISPLYMYWNKAYFCTAFCFCNNVWQFMLSVTHCTLYVVIDKSTSEHNHNDILLRIIDNMY